jgi:glycogen phosphorylase
LDQSFTVSTMLRAPDDGAMPPTTHPAAGLRRDFLRHLFYTQAKFPALASPHDCYRALAFAVRDRMLQRWISTAAQYTRAASRTVVYLSAEFLPGPHLANNLLCLGLLEEARRVVGELGLDFDALLAQEAEPALGNGGLGRLAACIMDSLATLEIPALGYGIRYEYGIFRQDIEDGAQVEKTDHWLARGNPWEIQRPEWAVRVGFGGRVERDSGADGHVRARWIPERTVTGVPYDTPVPGYANHTANTLRLWRAEADEAFDLAGFNRGDFHGAVAHKVRSEHLSRVLYPNDAHPEGKALRLEQEYFFVACTLRDLLRIMRTQRVPLERLPEKFVIQLNDTHPALAVAELMRVLLDEQDLAWDTAWELTRRSFAYTNHTLLPEALERWPLELFARTLPRHLEIVYEINARHLDAVAARFPGDGDRRAALSLIDEHGERYVRMAHLACVGSHTVNGVAALHTQLLQRDLLRDFHALAPEKFRNVTNGVSPRRWLLLANPRLSRLLTETLGPDWTHDLATLRGLEPLADDAGFQSAWAGVRRANKRDLAELARRRAGVAVDPDTLFDVQVKRIHEYKRQHLTALHVLAMYQRLKADPHCDAPPRTVIFGGKAAPGYAMAKLIVEFIHAVAALVNRDSAVRSRLRVVFLPDFNVSTGQVVYPATDLSEQISTAGMEASGTGNMKFQMNGALTIGTLDGANIEIRERVGPDNFFLFGLTAPEVAARRAAGQRPDGAAAHDAELAGVLELAASDTLARGAAGRFEPLIEHLRAQDPYLVLADFAAYARCQREVETAYGERARWQRMSVLNTARCGHFSSDRTAAEYARDVWRVRPVPIHLVAEEDLHAGWGW